MTDSLAPLPARARKPKGEGHARRGEILAAAERIFVEHGYEGATIRKIADEVGLSSTALYMHFREKSEILHEICQAALEEMISVNEAIIRAPEPAAVRLRRLVEAYVTFGFENSNAYRLIYMTRPMEAKDGAQDVARTLGGELYKLFTTVIEEVRAEGRLEGDVEVTAQTLWAGAHGIISLMITKPYFAWVDRNVLSKSMLDSLFKGLIRS